MSELRVDSVKSKGGGAPDLPKGVTISGITTAVTLGATQIDGSNVNVSGVVTSATLSGSLLSTGTPTLGLGVTINSSGVVISGVATAGIVSATTLYGDGTNLTGVGATIAPLFYQPDPNDTGVSFPAGIGITFNQQVKAGTGNVTLSIANAGVAGTVVENFGVGSSVTISENRITIDPTADLSVGQDYHLSYPSGCFTNNEGSDYVGTAYTFQSRVYSYQLFVWGVNEQGKLGLNEAEAGDANDRSSPTQVPGTNWAELSKSSIRQDSNFAIKDDGTLWGWGKNINGQLAQNNRTTYSSPVQIPGTTWANIAGTYDQSVLATKTDGTAWSWALNDYGSLGQSSTQGFQLSSPVQIGSDTTWALGRNKITGSGLSFGAIKTDGTLFTWGYNANGHLGHNNKTNQSSPVQVPGTYTSVSGGYWSNTAIKTDGTLWTWGWNSTGKLGQNNQTEYSSPKQVPGTTWSSCYLGMNTAVATKTDGTLWSWGYNNGGDLGQNDRTHRSSPVQIPGTTWNECAIGNGFAYAKKTDGTLWAWGKNLYGMLGQNNVVYYSSPVQVGSETDWHKISGVEDGCIAIRKV